ncbi:MAG: peptidyl-tRNA hydrolase [Thermoproteota archaeon]|nr:MAG: peptidyl-tRNA hydrolase [Candidatus Korarchaeota archaeon]
MEVKQVIVVRVDLPMSRGKLAAQAAHAACGASDLARGREPEIWREWIKSGAKKVVVAVRSEEELLQVFEDAKRMGLPVFLVRDAGRTELPPGTLTAVAIGPHRSDLVDKVTGRLPLLR